VNAYCGYAGTILEVNLTTRCFSRIPLPAEYRAQLLSGKALAAQILLEHLTDSETALCEKNALVITSALLTGTGAPGSARFDVASLSPQDNRPAFSNCGGNFGLHLKQAGYDALILKGRCDRLSRLEISGDDVIFHDAADLQELDTGECRKQLNEKLCGRRFASLCIGPAGEHLVKFASLMADGHSVGRSGLGAVLGWKQLKAITMEGNKKIPLHDKDAVLEISKRWNSRLQKFTSESTGADHCTACPLHCVRHSRGENKVLEELGMDAIAAEAASQWAAEQGMFLPDIYRAIAFRQGIGDRLADGVDTPKEKSKKRRNISHERIMEAFGLNTDAEDFCKNYAEAVCTLGQCMFTVNGMESGMEVHLLSLLKSVTGADIGMEDLLAIGARSRTLEQDLQKKFIK